MKMSRTALYALALSSLIGITLLVAIRETQAHGTMQSPINRVYSCYLERSKNPKSDACKAAHAVGGAQAFYDWFEVNIGDANDRHRELIPDGKLCSAGRDKYKGFDLARNDWPATQMPQSGQFTFVYKATAAHKTKYFDFYVTKDTYDPTQPLKWSDLEDQPFCSIQSPSDQNGQYVMDCSLPQGKSGRHVIYNIWQRSDSPEAFYSCSDVIFGTGSTPSPTSVLPTPTTTSGPPTPTATSVLPTPGFTVNIPLVVSGKGETPPPVTPTPGVQPTQTVAPSPTAAPGEVRTGEGTFYDVAGTGSCSFDLAPDDRMVAAMNQTDYANARLCGAFVEVTGSRGSMVVRIVDSCGSCKSGDIDMSRESFPQIADPSAGRAPITWRIVSPQVDGAVVYNFKEGSSQWWAGVQVRNHRNPIATFAYLDANGQFKELPRQSYNFFIAAGGMGSGPFTFRIVDIYGNSIIDRNIPLRERGEVPGTVQFPPKS
ncbi:MAG: lytic polysaccharide monooxygenase [Chloroflexales bacterium]|nr:lytic polysaccharide monooxygenase [Chloroflexales bacterium]